VNDAVAVKASVVILTKNPGPLFRQVLPAVQAQATPWPFEIVVVDSGSTDGTVEFIRASSGVRLYQIPAAEFGHGKTRNYAVAQARGEYVAMLTHDALPADTDWLRALVQAIDAMPDAAGAFGRHLPYPGNNPFVARDITLHFDNFAAGPAVVRLDDRERYARDPGYRQFLHFFSDNNACLRRAVWERMPYPDVDFAEDQLWAQQVLEAGYAKVYVDAARVYHSHEYSAGDALRRAYDESRALRRLFGYRLCPSFAQLVAQSLHCSLRDYRYLLAQRRAWHYPSWLLRAPLHNLCRQLGFYLGERASILGVRFGAALSLDQAKKNQ